MVVDKLSVQPEEVQQIQQGQSERDEPPHPHHDISGSDSDSDASPTLSNSQNVKKRKKHTKISCDLCKQRKVRCDRAEPSCGWCARNNRVCIYSERRGPGFRLAQVQELEEKLHRLEALTFSLGRRLEDHITTDHGGGIHKHAFPPALSTSLDLTPTPPTQYAETDVHRNQIVDNPRTLPKISEPLGRGYSFTRTPSIAPSNSALVTDSSEGHSCNHSQSYNPKGASAIPETPGFLASSEALPPHDLAFSLVDLFFKHVNPWSPILDRKSTFDTLFGEGSSSNDEAKILLHAITATTLRFSRDPRLNSSLRKQYHDSARAQILLQVISNPSVHSLQALLILAIDVTGTANYSEALGLVALLVRNILHLQLAWEKTNYLEVAPEHRGLSSLHALGLPKPSSWIEDEGRRRLVWMAYILDRYLTVLDCSSFALPDHSMDRRLPTTYDLFSWNVPVQTRWPRSTGPLPPGFEDPNLGSFSYHCEVLTILSRVHTFLQSPIDVSSADEFTSWCAKYQSLDSELNTWLHSLPGEYGKISQLCHSDPGSKISNWIMLHAAFVMAVIRLHSAAAYPAISASKAAHSHFKPSYNAMQRCLGAVESLREIAQDTIKNSMLDLLGPLFAFSLWISARLLLVHAATMDCEVDQQIHFFITTLRLMGTYWQIASTYADLLTRVVNEGRQSAHVFSHNGHNGNGNGGNSTARSFKQMRMLACELHSILSERQRDDSRTTDIPAHNNELEYMDVFNYFNYPRIAARSSGSNTPLYGYMSSQSQHQQHMHESTSERDRDQDQSQDRNTEMVDQGTKSPEFAMPTRESDWFTFHPPRE